jgi:hypothetical protein
MITPSFPQHIARQVRFSEPRRHFAVSFGNLRCESLLLREAARRELAAKQHKSGKVRIA